MRNNCIDNQNTDNRRIAKNTVVLYIRSLLMLLISLYTSRVVIQTLGVTDYGIVWAVAGAVSMFMMVTNSFTGAVSRFLTYELGCGDLKKLNQIFCSSVNVFYLLGIIILVLGLTLGLWFLNTHMNIPADRMEAANYVMCCFLVSLVVNLSVTPYTAMIVAYERMNVFAYMSIVEAVLKLAVVFLLLVGDADRLVFYAVLQLGVAVLMRIVYAVYCRMSFVECRYSFAIDVPTVKEMFAFAGWTALDSVVYTFNKQGVEILINIFFGVVFSAARAIALQIEGVVNQFVWNFMTAINPQITKLYAAGHREKMALLVCRGARLSYFMMLFFAIPIIFEADTILKIWLGTYPEEAVLFTRLSLLLSLVYLMGNSLLTGCMAVGKIMRYSIQASIVSAFLFIGTYVMYKFGFRVEFTYLVSLFVSISLIIVKLAFLRDRMGFPVQLYVKDVVVKVMLVSIPVLIVPIMINTMVAQGLFRLCVMCVASTVSTAMFVYLIGLSREERNGVRKMICERIK